MLSLLACQISIPKTVSAADRDTHLEAIAGKVRRALDGERVDLVALPELSSIDYSRAAFERLDVLAEPLDGPSFRIWSDVARDFKVHVAYSFPRMSDTGYRISVGVAGPDGGLIGHYDKVHLAQFGASMEKEYFEAGQRVFVFEAAGYRVAPIICYDIRFPELARTLTVDHGVDVILHAGAYARDPSFFSWHHFVATRALENQVYFLSLNRAGPDFGSSMFCPPWIDEDTAPVAFADRDEDVRRLVVDRQAMMLARERYSFLKDRIGAYRS